MRRVFVRIAVAVVAAALLVATPLPGAAKTIGTPPVQFARAVLTSGSATGVVQSGGTLTLASGGLVSGTYNDPFPVDEPRGAVPFESGSWTSEWTATFERPGVPLAIDELVASWNAATPATTWIRTEMKARGSARETKWYTMGIWASGDGNIYRTSVGGQGDADGFIAIDTFIRDKKAAPLYEYQLRVTLYRTPGSRATPTVRMVGAMASAATAFDIPSAFGGSREVDLDVPRYSQEIHAGEFENYDGGGEAWCSPTSTAMVLKYWNTGPSASDLREFPGRKYTDPEVDFAARYTYDWHYAGTGNWPDNTAYAARYGMDAFVTRLRSLREAELFINAGIPLVASINGKLPGFLFGKTNGHLLVIRGFTRTGDVITNDPAVLSDPEARKVYGRADFENVWLGGSAGIVYVIHPPSVPLPANVAGLSANW
jgi:hypothetical protein